MDNRDESLGTDMSGVNRFSLDVENQIERNIVWLFGSRRSGTTWLGEQLLSFGTGYISEPDLTAHLDFPMAPNNMERRLDVRKKYESYFFSEKYESTWSYYLGKLILYRIYAQFEDVCKDSQKKGFLDFIEDARPDTTNPDVATKIIIKEASSVLDASDIISRCMPSSKIIVMLRDGRDVIDSFVDGRKEGGWMVKNPAAVLTQSQRLPFIERRAKLWVNQTNHLLEAYENHRKELRFLLKYEDLTNNTLENLKQIYQFIGINISDSQLDQLISDFAFEKIPESEKGPGKRNRSASPGKWKESFSKREIAKMNDILLPTLLKAGYE